MLLPEEVRSFLHQQLVVRVLLWVGGIEGRVSRVKDEQNYTQRKKVNLRALIRLLHDEFWSHVGSGSQVCFEEARAITTVRWRSETKICEPDVEFAVKHHIFRL